MQADDAAYDRQADTEPAFGLPAIELTLRTPVAMEALATLKRERPQLVVGAGTVLNELQMRQSIDAGADFLVCPDNTIHAALPLVRERSPLPWLHIAEVVAQEAERRGLRKLGLTGTRWLVDSEVYPAQLRARGLDFVRPTPEERAAIDRIIMDELVPGRQRPGQVEAFQRVMGRMKDAGCDGVILGCTEIPLVMNDGNSPLPTLDSTRLLARAALDRATRAA